MTIDATGLHFKTLNDRVRETVENKIVINNCIGQRYIASGMSDKEIIINGTPGNALGAYLNGVTLTVNGNAQDATGDTMNEGAIYIHGSSGDATGYAMRGGKIFVKDNAGYRAGIHMKAYKEKLPVLIIGGVAGSFLGEYQAGGVIVVLGLYEKKIEDNCNFCATGMHGGKIYLRTDKLPKNLPSQVVAKEADEEDLAAIKDYITEFGSKFNYDTDKILDHKFYVLTPNSQNPYKQLYTRN